MDDTTREALRPNGDYDHPQITRGAGDPNATYPRRGAYEWQEFAGLAIELGGYGDMTAVDPYSGDRLWIPSALTGGGDEFANALRKLADAIEANNDQFMAESREQRQAQLTPTQRRHAQEWANLHRQHRQEIADLAAAEIQEQQVDGQLPAGTDLNAPDWDYSKDPRPLGGQDPTAWVREMLAMYVLPTTEAVAQADDAGQDEKGSGKVTFTDRDGVAYTLAITAEPSQG